MAKKNEDQLLIVGNHAIVVKAPRQLTRDDCVAAAAYAATQPADPFAYRRALSRLAHWWQPADIGG